MLFHLAGVQALFILGFVVYSTKIQWESFQHGTARMEHVLLRSNLPANSTKNKSNFLMPPHILSATRRTFNTRSNSQKNMFLVYLTGNLRSFEWTSPHLVALLKTQDAFKDRPYYVFMHTWFQLESSDKAWWKTAGKPPSGVIQADAVVRDPKKNAFLNACHPSIGKGNCFISEIQNYSAVKIPTPLNVTGGTKGFLWSQHVQFYALCQVHKMAKSYLISQKLDWQDHTMIIKTRPDVRIEMIPSMDYMQSAAKSHLLSVFGVAKQRGSFSEAVFAAPFKAMDTLVSINYSECKAATVNDWAPELNFAAMLKALGIQMFFKTWRINICRVAFHPTKTRSMNVSLGKCWNYYPR